MQKSLWAVSLAVGFLITYVDAQPNWDDSGVTASALLLIAGIFGYFAPQRPWLWALALGVWIPLWGIYTSKNYGAVLALVIAFVGAYCGMGLRNLTRNQSDG